MVVVVVVKGKGTNMCKCRNLPIKTNLKIKLDDNLKIYQHLTYLVQRLNLVSLYRVSQKITLCWMTVVKQGTPCIIGDPANVMKDQAHAGKNVHWSDLWPILFRLGSLCSERPSQAVCPGRSGWKPPIKNLRCDWLRPGRPGWESRRRQREVTPLWLYSNCYL